MRCEIVDPLEHIPAIARILEECWAAPGVYYSEAYLRWQFAFPGPRATLALALDGDEPVACIARTPRRVRFRGAETDVGTVSWQGVRPGWQGRGLSTLVNKTLAESACGPDISFAWMHADEGEDAPVLSIGGRSWAKGCELARRTIAVLGPYEAYGFVPRGAPPADVIVAEDPPDEQLAALARAVPDHEALVVAPTREQLAHLRQDPRPHRTFLAKDSGGRSLGALLVAVAEVLTPRGRELLTTVEGLIVPEPSVAVLRALLHAASRTFRSLAGAVVSVPNAYGIPRELVADVGLRRTGSTFRGTLSSVTGDPILGAVSTNLEIV